MSRWELLSIRNTASLLLRDGVVRRAFEHEYSGENAKGRVNAILAGEPLHDNEELFLDDFLVNEARLYVRFLGRGADDDRYQISIVGFGGVYFVRAPEYDDMGLFDSLEAAEAYVGKNWNDNLMSQRGKQYRPAFAR
jgi:hypothetical protein